MQTTLPELFDKLSDAKNPVTRSVFREIIIKRIAAELKSSETVIQPEGDIIGVAVKQKDLMICLPKPNRHHDCIRYAVETLGLTPPIGAPALNQGFYTANGVYLNRERAFLYAKERGQIINPEAHKYLYSEDLW